METLTRNDQRAIAAEFLGTLFFVFMGTGAVVAALFWADDRGSALAVIALAHGLAILVAVGWTAKLSGGHINPAVTLGMLIARKITPTLGIAYIIAQCAGAIVASVLLKLAMSDTIEGTLGKHELASGVETVEGLLLEVILTFLFVLVIFNVAVSKKGWGEFAPIAIGLTITLVHFVALPFTGASVNPARSLGPALLDNEWGDGYFGDFLLLYVVGPFAGAAAAAVAWIWWKSFGDDDLDPAAANEAPAAM
ncbi:MAG: MIP family channel protein [Dehalococcoidia bacterium]